MFMKLLVIGLVFSGLAWKSDLVLEYMRTATHQQSPVALDETDEQLATEKHITSEQEVIQNLDNDPRVLTRYINDHTQAERTEADKLMNFLAHGTYE